MDPLVHEFAGQSLVMSLGTDTITESTLGPDTDPLGVRRGLLDAGVTAGHLGRPEALGLLRGSCGRARAGLLKRTAEEALANSRRLLRKLWYRSASGPSARGVELGCDVRSDQVGAGSSGRGDLDDRAVVEPEA